MNQTNRTEISKTDFINSVGECVLLNGNFTAVTCAKSEKYDQKKPQVFAVSAFQITEKPLYVVEYQLFQIIKRPNNKLESGVVFGRCARSRVGSNITIYSELHEHERNYNLTFLTLTFPSFVDVDQIYCSDYHDIIFTACVQRFFKRLKRENKIFDFVWFAERHTESEKHDCGKCETRHAGWLHYHCFVWFNGFQPIKEINSIWHDIISKSSVKFKRFNSEGREFASVDAKYLRKSVKTDIHKLINYVKKYVTKDSGECVFYSRCWGWSRGVSSVVSKTKISKSEFEKTLLPFVSKCYKMQIYNDLTGENTFTLYMCTFQKRIFEKVNKYIYLDFFKCLRPGGYPDLFESDLKHDKFLLNLKKQ